MYDVATLEQALEQKKLKNFATKLGLVDAESKDIVECSKFINEKVSENSEYTLDRFMDEFYGEYDEMVKITSADEEKAFDKQFAFSLLLDQKDYSDSTDHIIGAVFKSVDNHFYILHIRFEEDTYIPHYYFNSKHVGQIDWVSGGDGFTTPDDFYHTLDGRFHNYLVEKITGLVDLDQDVLDNYLIA